MIGRQEGDPACKNWVFVCWWWHLDWSFARILAPVVTTHHIHHLSLRFNGHFPGEPGLAGVYWSKGWWKWWWQLGHWSYKSCKAPVISSPPTNQYSVFLQAGCPSCRPTNSVRALKGNITFHGLPTLSLTTNSSWLPWGRVAMPLISPLMPVPQYPSPLAAIKWRMETFWYWLTTVLLEISR